MAQKHVRGVAISRNGAGTANGDLRAAILDFDLCFYLMSKLLLSEPLSRRPWHFKHVFPFPTPTGPVTMEFTRARGKSQA
jgi:hypothetical protein